MPPHQKRARTIWIAQIGKSYTLVKFAIVSVNSDWQSQVNCLDLKYWRKKDILGLNLG